MAERPLLAAILVAVLAAPLPAAPKPAPGPKNPRDFSGVWMNRDTLDEKLKREGLHRLPPGTPDPAPYPTEMPLTPEYKKKYAALKAEEAKLAEGAAKCMWVGVPRILTYPYPMEMLHTPGRITMIFEADSQVRRIFLNGKHPPEDELDPSFNGDSIGHWEGNTLVVDTVGFNTDTTVGRGMPHSEKMHIVERIRYVDAQTIHDDVTITDPLAFTKPITQTIVYERKPDWKIKEYSCEENNRDAPDKYGQRKGGLVGDAPPPPKE